MKFRLEPYTTPSSRYQCPRCNHRNKTFVRYINTETGDHVAPHVGRCGREINCGYHYKPGKFFESEGLRSGGRRQWRVPKPKRRPGQKHHRPSPACQAEAEFLCINPDIVNATFFKYHQNNFVQYLLGRFGWDVADQLVGRYRIGTAKHWPGATVFWQLDTLGNVRSGKVMLYDAATGKRVKKPFNHVTWAHSLLISSRQFDVGGSELAVVSSESEGTHHSPLTTHNFKLKQCLFGEHLLKETPPSGGGGLKPVAIVESEKTAIIASAHDDSMIWLASGCLGNLNARLCQPLKGRTVTLYPDLGAYDKWKAKALQLQQQMRGTTFMVSDLLERYATEADRKAGLDIGDFL